MCDAQLSIDADRYIAMGRVLLDDYKLPPPKYAARNVLF
jgi:hypothetical protein